MHVADFTWKQVPENNSGHPDLETASWLHGTCIFSQVIFMFRKCGTGEIRAVIIGGSRFHGLGLLHPQTRVLGPQGAWPCWVSSGISHSGGKEMHRHLRAVRFLGNLFFPMRNKDRMFCFMSLVPFRIFNSHVYTIRHKCSKMCLKILATLL